jgi:DNA-directed RNA polymerase specialized sigma24 family protein
MLERIETLQEKLKWENELYDRLRAQVEEAIEGLPQEKMRLVLLYHYLEGKSFLQVGDLLYMDKGTANRWAVRALEFLILPEDPITIDGENCNECLRVPADATPGSVLQ